jgi:DNA-binding SARP family transcriptional activator
LLDGFAVEVAEPGTAVRNLPFGVQRLIAHVSLSGRPGRGATAGQLWPDVSEASAGSNLRSALWRLQKAAPGLLDVSGGGLRLADDVSVDARELCDWARRVLDPRSDVVEFDTPEVALRGDLLPGWYDDWVLLERERLRQLRVHALEALADRLAAAGRFGDAVEAAMAAVRGEPLRESAHRAVVRVHLAEGNVAEAVREYDTFRHLLEEELGVVPSPQMEALVRGLRVPKAHRARR